MNTLYTVPTIVFTSHRLTTKPVISNVICNLAIFKTYKPFKFILGKLIKSVGLAIALVFIDVFFVVKR